MGDKPQMQNWEILGNLDDIGDLEGLAGQIFSNHLVFTKNKIIVNTGDNHTGDNHTGNNSNVGNSGSNSGSNSNIDLSSGESRGENQNGLSNVI
jgi:hypothetical protein